MEESRCHADIVLARRPPRAGLSRYGGRDKRRAQKESLETHIESLPGYGDDILFIACVPVVRVEQAGPGKKGPTTQSPINEQS